MLPVRAIFYFLVGAPPQVFPSVSPDTIAHQEPIKQDIRATYSNLTQKAKKIAGFQGRNFSLSFFSPYSMLRTASRAKSHRRKHNREKMQVERIPKPKKKKRKPRPEIKRSKRKTTNTLRRSKIRQKYLSEITKTPEGSKSQ